MRVIADPYPGRVNDGESDQEDAELLALPVPARRSKLGQALREVDRHASLLRTARFVRGSLRVTPGWAIRS